MLYTSFIQQKAQDRGIDLNQQVGGLAVCKYLLESLSWRFSGDLRKVIEDIEDIEEELREVKNALLNLKAAKMATSLRKAGCIKSLDRVLTNVMSAYGYICAITSGIEAQGKTIPVYNDVFQNLHEVQQALMSALQEFCPG